MMFRKHVVRIVSVVALFLAIRFVAGMMPPGFGEVTRKVYVNNALSPVKHYGDYCLCIKSNNGKYAWSWYCSKYFFDKYDIGDRVTLTNLFSFIENQF